jgi:hypothetical protein
VSESAKALAKREETSPAVSTVAVQAECQDRNSASTHWSNDPRPERT